MAHYAKCLMLNSNTMHQVINAKTITEVGAALENFEINKFH